MLTLERYRELRAQLGSDAKVARHLGYNERTLRRWKTRHLTEHKTLDRAVGEEKAALLAGYREAAVKSLVREKARTEILADVIRAAVAALPPSHIPKPQPVMGQFDDEDATLLVSDCQVGQELTSEETGGLGEYSSETFERRAEKLLKSVRRITGIHRRAYDLPRLNLWFLGDLAENETVFEGQRSWVDSDVVTQLFRACEVFCEFIVSLLADYGAIRVVGITGNHGRLGRKGEFKQHVNWDYLAYRFMEARLRGDDRVSFVIPKSWWHIERVRGWNFLLLHGDDIRSWNALPYYGIDRADARYTLLLQSIGKSYEYMCIGHHHNRAEIDRPVGEKIVNGAWPGGSMYSLKTLNVANRPSQLFFGVHERQGITWRYKLYLD